MKLNDKQEWEDISNEEYRTYTVATRSGAGTIRVSRPKGLKEIVVPIGDPENGITEIEHLILDELGEYHRIPSGWLKISFKLKIEAKKEAPKGK